MPARRDRAGGGDLRTGQRRRHGDARAAGRGLCQGAHAAADFGRRSDRLPPGARKARDPGRRVQGGERDRRARRLCLCHPVRQGAPLRLCLRQYRRRHQCADPAAPRQRARGFVRRRQADPCRARPVQIGRARRLGLSARRHLGRADFHDRGKHQPVGARAQHAMARGRARRADPARSSGSRRSNCWRRARALMSASPALASRSSKPSRSKANRSCF